MKKIYLSGPISIFPLEEALHHFDTYEHSVKKAYPEAAIYNPMKLVEYDKDKKWQDYMRPCLHNLEQCDTIIMLPGWELSNGAMCEYYYAKGLGINIVNFTTDIFPQLIQLRT